MLVASIVVIVVVVSGAAVVVDALVVFSAVVFGSPGLLLIVGVSLDVVNVNTG